jgi:hypothetical protein
VPDNSFEVLELHKCDYHESDNPLDWCASAQLREQLMAEIHALDERLSALRDSLPEMDFSMQQTCREMIHSRQQLFLQLRR